MSPETNIQNTVEVKPTNFSKVGVWRKFNLMGVDFKAMLYRSGSYRVAVPGVEKLVAGDTFEEALYNALTLWENLRFPVFEIDRCGTYDTSFDVLLPYDTSFDVQAA
jgi:hypothetical protein